MRHDTGRRAALTALLVFAGLPTASPGDLSATPLTALEPSAGATPAPSVLGASAQTARQGVGEQEAPVARTVPEDGAVLRVWLVTAGPGDAVWERYGHNAIRILDTRTGRDVSYNWGIFDFQQVDFIPRFLQGRMLYMMAPFPTQAMIDAYGRADREIVLQELDLTPAEKLELRNLAELNALPENRDYTYQYFLDNCSTRVRDLLNRVLGGAIQGAFGGVETGTSYRFHTRRLTQIDPLIYTGMDMLLGRPTDQPITVWEEMFLPLTLRDEIRGLTIERPDGSARPLVQSEEVAVTSARGPAAEAPPSWMWLYLLVGLALGGLFTMLGTGTAKGTVVRRSILGLAIAWLLLGGVAGGILVFLLFTDHTFAYWNENLFLFHPLLLGLAVLLPASRLKPQWGVAAARVAAIVAGIAVVG
ncbi:MAG: DUF4105 domain-containing protein, partial [Gemmatimonadetes bacterium]|nr:DUF4105 domain-containing protein [Gemmatimonadota bacterium]